MPRRPLSPHVLRSTRNLYNLSQAKLATLVGCTPITIKQIESRKLKPSPTLAHRIFMQTGLNPDQLISNRWPERPMHPAGGELTPDYFERIREIRTESETQEEVDRSLKHFSVILETLLDASLTGRKFWAVRPAILGALDKIIDNFYLRSEFQKLLKTRWGVEDAWSFHSVASLYVKVNADDKIKEQANNAREEFFLARENTHRALKPLHRQKAPRSLKRGRGV